MKTGIATLAAMLSVMGVLIIGAALTLNEPARLYWFLFASQLILVCTAFLIAWSASELLSHLSKSDHRGFAIVQIVMRLVVAGLVFMSVDWIHHKPQIEESIHGLSGMEGSFANATHQGMQVFIFACFTVIIVKLILSYVQGVVLGQSNRASESECRALRFPLD